MTTIKNTVEQLDILANRFIDSSIEKVYDWQDGDINSLPRLFELCQLILTFKDEPADWKNPNCTCGNHGE